MEPSDEPLPPANLATQLFGSRFRLSAWRRLPRETLCRCGSFESLKGRPPGSDRKSLFQNWQLHYAIPIDVVFLISGAMILVPLLLYL